MISIATHVIRSNKARCKKCNTVIESRWRYDYKKCACGSISVDGGDAYLSRSWPEGDDPDKYIEELSEYEVKNDTQ